MPAGNAFTNYATPAGSDYTNSAALSLEYYYSTVAGLPNQEPINTLGNISKIGLSLNPECTIAFNDFAPDPDPDEVVAHMVAEKAKLDLTLAEYEQLGSPTPNQTLKVVEQLNVVHRQLNWSINHLVQDSLHDNSTRIATLLDAEGSALAALAKQTLSLSRIDSAGYAAERTRVAKTGQWTVSRNLQEYDQWGEQMLGVFADRVDELVTVQLRDLTGRVVYTNRQTSVRQSFELPQGLAGGVYLISINNPRTGDRITRRLLLTQ
jgi:hypothetical protein